MLDIFYFKRFASEKLRNSILITGYQGFGLVGYLSTRHIVLELNLERIGFIKTKYMPEITFYSDKQGLAYPFEVYYGEVGDKKLVVVLNQGIPSRSERSLYAEFIAKWAKEVGVSMAILIGGLDSSIRESSDEEYRWIPIGGYEGKLDAPILSERYVIGPLALTMMFFDAYEIPGVAIFAYTEMYRPDPRASAVVVKAVSKLLNIDIDAKKLLEEASAIEAIEEEKRKMLRAVEEGLRSERRDYSMHV